MLYKLMVGEPSYDLEYLVEEKNKNEPSTLYIHGPYLMAETVNKNKRRYQINEVRKEVSRFSQEMIKERRSLGELNHPQSVEINPRDACHLITELKEDNNIFIGKSKVLTTPLGNVVRSLILDGVKLGISSRALGKLDKKDDHNEVSDLHLITCDVVTDPSANKCFIDGVLESKQYIINSAGVISEAVEDAFNSFESNLSNLPKHDVNMHVQNAFIDFIKMLKSK